MSWDETVVIAYEMTKIGTKKPRHEMTGTCNLNINVSVDMSGSVAPYFHFSQK